MKALYKNIVTNVVCVLLIFLLLGFVALVAYDKHYMSTPSQQHNGDNLVFVKTHLSTNLVRGYTTRYVAPLLIIADNGELELNIASKNFLLVYHLPKYVSVLNHVIYYETGTNIVELAVFTEEKEIIRYANEEDIIKEYGSN